MKTVLSAAVGAMLALAAIGAVADGAPGERRVVLEIQSKTLADALDEWARQSGYQIFVQNWDLTKKLTAPTLRGTFTAQAALERLLEGTPLSHAWLSDRAVAIRERAESSPSAASGGSQTSRDHKVLPLTPVEKLMASNNSGGVSDGRDQQGSGRAGLTVPIDEMIVTGTYIRGAAPSSSPVITYTSRDIERSGATTLAGFLEKIPQNFASVGGDTVQVNTAGLNSARNPSFGTAINLRGLGPGSTLVLLNGRRLAPAGGLGQFVDASLIPLSAIERVEILTDGASAIYGADAIGGVVNFILRSDFNGVEASLRSGGSTRGGAQEIGGSLLAGAASDRGHISFVYDGVDEDGLDASRRSFIPDQGGPFLILPSQTRNSFLLSGEHDLTDSVSIYADAIHSKRSYDQDATQLVPVLTSSHNEGDVTQTSGVVGIRSELWRGWAADLSGSYSENKETGTSVAEGFPDTLNDTDTRLTSLDLHADGTIGSLGGGAARAAVGVSYRREKYEDLSGSNAGGKADRNVASAAAEVLLPFVSGQNARPGIYRLEVSLATRFEDYDDFGSSVNPKVGVLWSPIEGLALRSTYTESFRAPPLGLLSEANPFGLQIGLANPAAADLDTTTLIFSTAGNSHLKSETSESFTVGFDIGLLPIDGLSLSATYFSVDYTDRIALPPVERDLFSIFDQETPLTPYMDSNPTAATIADLYARAAVFDATGLGPNGVETIFYLVPQNVARSRTSGAQLAAAYQFPALDGRADLYLAGDFLFESKYTPVPGAASADLIDGLYNPPRYRVRGGMNVSRGGLAASLNLNYLPSYPNTLVTPNEQIDSWFTADARLAYQFDAGAESAILRNFEIALAAENFTDEEPPAVTSNNPFSNFGYDPTNATPRGRFVTLSLRKSW
jgi:outer membrane receptor protein involved in Fe transport